MCRRAIPPAAGEWVLPSGYLEIGETLQQGAARETQEETGVVVDHEKLELYSIVNMPLLGQITVAFRTDLPALPPTLAGPECSEVEFVPVGRLSSEDFAWSKSMGDSVETLLAEIESHCFQIHLVTIGRADGEGFWSRRYHLA